MATITCHCGTAQISLSTRKPRLCCECCCVDCFQKNDTAGGGPSNTPQDLATRCRAPTLLYFENQIKVQNGNVAFEKLREGANSINMVCTSCRTVLCVDHPAYQAKSVLVFPDWATVEGYNPIPATVRWCVKDWSETELDRLPSLPSIWSVQGGKFEGDGVPLFMKVSGMLRQDFEKKDTHGNFQSLLEGNEINILGLAEDPRSFKLSIAYNGT